MNSREEKGMPERLGHFEQVVLTAIVMEGGEAYGVPIYDRLCAMEDKRMNLGSLYLTLDRLEEKSLLASRQAEEAGETRGRPRRYYRLLPAGLQALEDSVENARRLSEMFEENRGTIRKWITRQTQKVVHRNLSKGSSRA